MRPLIEVIFYLNDKTLDKEMKEIKNALEERNQRDLIKVLEKDKK